MASSTSARLKTVLLAAASASLLTACAQQAGNPEAPRAAAVSLTGSQPGTASSQDPAGRTALFGDLHLHTSYSFDAYVLMGTKTTPEEAYRFARGETINYLGQPVRRAQPLDFQAVTDHSENLGVFNELEDRESALSRSALGRQIRGLIDSGQLSITARRSSGDAGNAATTVFALLGRLLGANPTNEVDTAAISSAAWQRQIDTANAYYQPGRFTTFIGYEWTSMPDGRNLHRNVIFRGNTAPSPFSSINSNKPEDLWAWLSAIRTQGHEALAIPHNANASGGLMYDWNTLDGRPIDASYAALRAANEPLSEIAQNKGTSETHPSLSSEDEFANFEIWDRLLISATASRPSGSYVRDEISRGLVLGQRLGVNPYKDGFIGSGDLHGGLSVSAEKDYAGNIGSANLGGGVPDRAVAEAVLTAPPPGDTASFNVTISGSGALTGVWANENTRESIYDAFRRKETFATSGSRLKVRLFAGWNLPSSLATQPDWVAQGYRLGVPMGSDLPARPSNATVPSFLVWALKDPDGANLDRVQIVKLWVENGQQKEKIFDVAFQPGRGRDPATGDLALIGSTVDLSRATYSNTIGSTQLATVWRDPEFDPATPAAYYIRALEIPTPRWTTLLAARAGLPVPTTHPTIQERAWSSPVWYTPG